MQTFCMIYFLLQFLFRDSVISIYSSDWSCRSCNKYPILEHASCSVCQKPGLKDQTLDKILVFTTFLPALFSSHYKGDNTIEIRSTSVAYHLPWGDSAFNLPELFSCLHPPSSRKMLPDLAHRKVRKRKSYYYSTYLLNYTVALGQGGGSEGWFIIFWQCQITAHPLAPDSSLSMSNTPQFAVTDCEVGNGWWAHKSYFNGLRAHSTGSQNQKSKRWESHFSSSSLVLACSLNIFSILWPSQISFFHFLWSALSNLLPPPKLCQYSSHQ